MTSLYTVVPRRPDDADLKYARPSRKVIHALDDEETPEERHDREQGDAVALAVRRVRFADQYRQRVAA